MRQRFENLKYTQEDSITKEAQEEEQRDTNIAK